MSSTGFHLVFRGSEEGIPEKVFQALSKFGGVNLTDLKKASNETPLTLKPNITKEKAEAIIGKFSKLGVELSLIESGKGIKSSLLSHLTETALNKEQLIGAASSIKDKAEEKLHSEGLKDAAANLKEKADSFKETLSEQAKDFSNETKKKKKILSFFQSKVALLSSLTIVLLVLVFSVTFLLLSPFRGSDEIQLVKNGAIADYPNNQIGPMLEQAFSDGTWNFYHSQRGIRVVQFKGYITEDLHDEAVLWLENLGFGNTATSIRTNMFSKAEVFEKKSNLFAEQYPDEVEYFENLLEAYRDYKISIGCEETDKQKITLSDKRYTCPKGSSGNSDASKQIYKHVWWPVGKEVELHFGLSVIGNDVTLLSVHGTMGGLTPSVSYRVMAQELYN